MSVCLAPRQGAAGSAAVLSGGAVVGAWDDPWVWSLALMVFLWTPSHFWSLVSLYREDYRRGGLPMLPTQTSERQAAWWVLLHTGASALVAILLAASPALGWGYLLVVVAATVELIRRNLIFIGNASPANARVLFVGSNGYLMIVVAGILINVLW